MQHRGTSCFPVPLQLRQTGWGLGWHLCRVLVELVLLAVNKCSVQKSFCWDLHRPCGSHTWAAERGGDIERFVPYRSYPATLLDSTLLMPEKNMLYTAFFDVMPYNEVVLDLLKSFKEKGKLLLVSMTGLFLSIIFPNTA